MANEKSSSNRFIQIALILISFSFVVVSEKKCGHKIKTSIKKDELYHRLECGWWLVGWVDSLIFSTCMLFSCTAQLNCVEVFMVKSPWTQLLYKLPSLLQVVRVVENKLTKKPEKFPWCHSERNISSEEGRRMRRIKNSVYR